MARWIELDKLPQELVAAIQTDHYNRPTDKPSDYSASKLIAPIQQTELKRRHKDSKQLIPSDPLDGFHAWVGNVIHNAIEAAWKADMGSVVEERFYKNYEVDGKKFVVSGMVDCLDGDTIKDWKTCRAHKVVKGDVDQWEKQQNIYAGLAEHNGHTVDHLHIYPIIMDLKKHEAKYKKDLPNKPVVLFDLDRWTNDAIDGYIVDRITLLEKAKGLSDEELFQQIPCSREDQWSSYKDTPVFKIGEKRATKVFYDKREATEWLANHKNFTTSTHEVRDRYKARTRCLDYCDVKNICMQFQKEEGLIKIDEL